MLRDEFDSKVPDNFDDPDEALGVGKKERQSYYGRCLWKVYDRNRHTLHSLLQQDWSGDEQKPKKVEMVRKIIPPEEGSDFCHRLVYHVEVCNGKK